MRKWKLSKKQAMAAVLSVVLGVSTCVSGFGYTANAQYLEKTGLFIRKASESVGIHVNTPSQAEIKARVAAVREISPAYAEVPSVEAPYSAGSLSSETLNNALEVLNVVRFIAGVPDDVTLSAEYSEKAQAAALVNYVNNQMSHNPNKPADMDNSLYQLGAAGAGASNIGSGWGGGSYYLNGRPFFQAIIHGWMCDKSESNIPMVGHRRWVINPSMGKTGFGQVWGKKDGKNVFHSAMYAFDKSSSQNEYYGVAWPAQNMPVSFFGNDYPWSISMGKSVPGDTVVTLKRKGDAKTWTFQNGSNDFYINNAGYGQTGCIIFRPSGISSYQAGDVFDVSISGTGLNVKYTVNFFDLSGNGNNSSTPSPTPTATATVTPTPTATATVTPTPTPMPTVKPTATPSPTPTVKPTATPTVKPTATPTPSPTVRPTASPTPTPTVRPTATPVPTPKVTPSPVPTGTPVASQTPQMTATPVIVPTATPDTGDVENPSVYNLKKVTITSAVNKKGKKLTVKWKKVEGASAYIVECSTNKKFPVSKKLKTIKKTSFTFNGLKKKKTYYIRIRAVGVDKNGYTFAGKYSAVKKVKVTK